MARSQESGGGCQRADLPDPPGQLYLLDRQLHELERHFIEVGGYSEGLAAARLEKRRQRSVSDPADRTEKMKTVPAAPSCKACGKPMVLRTARKGPKNRLAILGLLGLSCMQSDD